jgi:hypothetical protein
MAVFNKTHTQIVPKQFTLGINCADLYTLLRQKLGTQGVSVYAQGCIASGTEFRPAGSKVYIPDQSNSITSYCPPGYDFYQINADYSGSSLSPDTRMTRAEFLIEILDIWESLSEKTNPLLKEIKHEIELVLKYTRNIYSVCELADISYLDKHMEAAV